MLASQDDGVAVVAQPWSIGRRFAVASIMFLGIGLLVFATAGTNEEGRVSGAGSTLVNPILQRVSTSYQSYLAADRVDVVSQEGQSGDWTAGATALDYDPVGSIGGLVRLADPAVTFAATEVPVSAKDLEERGLVQFPLINGAAAPVANLDLAGKALTLDADTLAAIFVGKITTWSDPAIAALNPDVALPDLPIAVRYRGDGSGTTWTFTGYLARSADWTMGQAAQVKWPVGEAAEGSRGIIAAVDATPGAIGYAEVGQAGRAGLDIVNLVNGAGEVVEPKPQTIRAAVGAGFWTASGGISTAVASSGGDWPMTATVFVVMRRDQNTAQNDRALNFFRYFYVEAPRQADALGYVALPTEVVAEVEAHWATAFKPKS
ncbi:phosphate ABC transporter substrate-binding protein PstS [Tabrizicola sp.]|uniref:phosphate ABC transporter substrate-binding protein PstS n=1 Tax=Tabrizicola sp. TaxID=2005166 RepID=UPI003F3C80B4